MEQEEICVAMFALIKDELMLARSEKMKRDFAKVRIGRR